MQLTHIPKFVFNEWLDTMELIVATKFVSKTLGTAMGATIIAGFGIALGTVSFGVGALVGAGLATAWAWADCYSTGFN